jgi:hypothetical protein
LSQYRVRPTCSSSNLAAARAPDYVFRARRLREPAARDSATLAKNGARRGQRTERDLSDLSPLREEALRAGGTGNVKVLWALGDRDGAVQAARSAAEKDPDRLETEGHLFRAVYATNRSSEAATLAARLWRRTDAAAGLPSDVLLMMADAARAVGKKDEATRYRNRAEEMIELARRSGVAADHVDLERAALAVYDGRDQEAVALFVANLATFAGSRSDLDLPILRRLALRPDLHDALRTFDGTLADQRLRVLRMLCGPDRVSTTWNPAPETCARLAMGPDGHALGR